MSDLHAIAYVSSATHLLLPAEIDRLLLRARERNAASGVTGLLLYGDGSFMQYLEGPRDELIRIFAIICRDPLHQDVEQLLNEPIREREFGDWAMAFRQEMLPAFMKPARRWRPSAVADDGESQALGQGRELLRSVWSTFRGRP